jgi:cytochrome c biogenesis protein CcmG/thiol:disulfide interchange protein DsbE
MKFCASAPERFSGAAFVASTQAVRKAALVVLFLLVAASLHAAPAKASLVHRHAPLFVRDDLSGKRISLRAYRGKVVLLNFWATWCGPCRIELPRFAAWQDEYGSAGLQVIAVSMDDSAAQVRPVARKMKLDFPVVMGDEKLGVLYGGVLGLPITFLIDRNGRISARFEGDADLPAVEKNIKDLLARH